MTFFKGHQKLVEYNTLYKKFVDQTPKTHFKKIYAVKHMELLIITFKELRKSESKFQFYLQC